VVALLLVLPCLSQAPPATEFSTRLNTGAKLIQENKLDAAIVELKRAAALQPRSAVVHLFLGQAYFGKAVAEFVAEAKAEFQQAKELDPDQVLGSFYIAKIDLDLGRLNQAERELRAAIARKPKELYLTALLGEVRRRQGHPQEAIDLTTRALEADPQAAPFYYYRALAWWDLKDEARAMYDLNRITSSPFATVEAYLTSGQIQLHFNRLTQAEASFRKAVAMGADRAEPRLRLAQALRRQGRRELALKELDRVDASSPLSSPYFQTLLADAAVERGLILRESGDTAGANAAFLKAKEIDPSRELP
jgi:predicted Zn-dependent protease